MTQRISLAEQKVVYGFSASTDNNILKNATMSPILFFGKVIEIDKVLHDIAYSLFYIEIYVYSSWVLFFSETEDLDKNIPWRTYIFTGILGDVVLRNFVDTIITTLCN